MARASTVTKLPLDRWAQIMGVSPLCFNQLSSDSQKDATNNRCGHVWFQQNYQNADRISREELAIAIRSAEDEIEGFVHYNLLPDWTILERLQMPRTAMRELYNLTGWNIRGQFQSVDLKKSYPISGGVRTKVGIETAAVTLSDSNGDGFSDLATVATIGTSVEDANEIRCYYPGEDGADEWEIRPITVVLDTDANTAVITFSSTQIVDPDLLSALDAETVDGDVPGNFLSTVDVYRVYNDPQTQGDFLTEGMPVLWASACCPSATCVACQLNRQTICFTIRDEELGTIVPAPGDWNAANQQFDSAALARCRQADQIRVSYYSGWQLSGLTRSAVNMDPYWERAVAYLAASRLFRDVCGCSNVEAAVRRWHDDLAFASEGKGAHQITQSQLENPFGTKRGEINAWNRVMEEGRTIPR